MRDFIPTDMLKVNLKVEVIDWGYDLGNNRKIKKRTASMQTKRFKKSIGQKSNECIFHTEDSLKFIELQKKVQNRTQKVLKNFK